MSPAAPAPPRLAASLVEDAALLDQFGWPMGVGTFRILRSAVLSVLAALAGLAAALATLLISATSSDAAGAITLCVVGACAYALILHAVRETMSSRRAVLARHPQSGFFIALDVPERWVVLAGAQFRIAVLIAPAAGLAVGSLAALTAVGTDDVVVLPALATAPLACGATMLAITLGLAARRGQWTRQGTLATLGVAALAGSGLGWLTARIVDSVAEAASLDGGLTGAAVSIPMLLVGILTVGATATAAAAASWRRLAADGFVQTAAAAPGGAAGASWVSGAAPSPLRWEARAWARLRGGTHGASVVRFAGTAWLAGWAAVVLILSSGTVRDLVAAGPVDRAAGVVMLLVGITAAELVVRRIGPVAAAGDRRLFWELGAGAGRLAAAPLTVGAACTVAAAAPLILAGTLLGARPTAMVALLIACAAAGFLGGALVSADRPDGQGGATVSAASGVISVGLAAAALAAVIFGGAAAAALSEGASVAVDALVVMIYGGSAWWCSRARILKLPSTLAI